MVARHDVFSYEKCGAKESKILEITWLNPSSQKQPPKSPTLNFMKVFLPRSQGGKKNKTFFSQRKVDGTSSTAQGGLTCGKLTCRWSWISTSMPSFATLVWHRHALVLMQGRRIVNGYCMGSSSVISLASCYYQKVVGTGAWVWSRFILILINKYAWPTQWTNNLRAGHHEIMVSHSHARQQAGPHFAQSMEKTHISRRDLAVGLV